MAPRSDREPLTIVEGLWLVASIIAFVEGVGLLHLAVG